MPEELHRRSVLFEFAKGTVHGEQHRMKFTMVAALFFVAIASSTAAEKPPAMEDADRIRIAEAFRLADAIGDKIWPKWNEAPFAVLLITPDHEFLIRHPSPSAEFTLIGDDAVLKQRVWFRKRQNPIHFLATFPAVGMVSTIVVGQAENTTAKTSTPWVITMLHEHFHQLQASRPGYYAEVDALGLTGGDETGMWMLNYPFPYMLPEVEKPFSLANQALAETLQAKPRADFAEKLVLYLAARSKFRDGLSSNDRKYLEFQAWQEGIARYTEYHVARLAAMEYEASEAFQALPDFTSFDTEARSILENIETELHTGTLAEQQRTAFYALGAAEGLLLDQACSDWQKDYFEKPFSLDFHFEPKADAPSTGKSPKPQTKQ